MVYEGIANAALQLNDTSSNTIATYSAEGVIFNYLTDGDDPFAGFSILGYVVRQSVVGDTGFLSSSDAQILLLDCIFINDGPYQRGQTVMTINGLGRQPDWKYFRPIAATMSTLDSSVVIEMRGHFFNSLMRDLQVGTGASDGNIQNTGAAWDFDARYEFEDLVFNNQGVIQVNLGNYCTCDLTSVINNWDNSPFQSGPLDYAVAFDPQFRRDFARISQLTLIPYGDFEPSLWGLDPLGSFAGEPENYLHLRGYAVDAADFTQLFLLDLWFRGRATPPPVTGYGAPVGTPGPDWQFFDLISGTMSFSSNNSGYTVFQLNSSEILYNGPAGPDEIGPSLQIGTGANILNPNIYGGLFLFMYQFQYGTAFFGAVLTIAINPEC